jgi:hypothetical protein
VLDRISPRVRSARRRGRAGAGLPAVCHTRAHALYQRTLGAGRERSLRLHRGGYLASYALSAGSLATPVRVTQYLGMLGGLVGQ